ncbi:MAG TPA: hypothetical protein IGS52_23995 [Oscillatoriaceae cyanobacterium M33_DOE_052]|nr:hypothetical protein [Oscillatoriaceae cyanobacterium M33_DOE_052]
MTLRGICKGGETGDGEQGRRGDGETGRRGDGEMVPQSPGPPVSGSPWKGEILIDQYYPPKNWSAVI